MMKVRYDCLPLSPRRRSTVRRLRSHARDAGVPKSVELEHRLSRLELAMKGVRDSLDLFEKRMIALQAQLDHIAARLR